MYLLTWNLVSLSMFYASGEMIAVHRRFFETTKHPRTFSLRTSYSLEVSVCDMDWTLPTAIVLGNEHKGVSDEALELSDMRCSISMVGMVDSLNVSVAAGICMHSAVRDRIFRMGSHGDLCPKHCQILTAEFYLRHKKNVTSILDRIAEKESLGEVCLS